MAELPSESSLGFKDVEVVIHLKRKLCARGT
jgi:hypothetical protein